MFGFRVGRTACLAGAEVVFGFEGVKTALGLVTSLPVESLFSLVVVCEEGNGVRRRRSPRVNSIFSQQQQQPAMVLPLEDLYVYYFKILNSLLYITMGSCVGEFARFLLEMKKNKRDDL